MSNCNRHQKYVACHKTRERLVQVNLCAVNVWYQQRGPLNDSLEKRGRVWPHNNVFKCNFNDPYRATHAFSSPSLIIIIYKEGNSRFSPILKCITFLFCSLLHWPRVIVSYFLLSVVQGRIRYFTGSHINSNGAYHTSLTTFATSIKMVRN